MLPAAIVYGVGLALTVAPLTAAVLAAVDDRHLGVGSATNNAVARLAGLLAVAVLPAAAGVDLVGGGPGGLPGYTTAMDIAATLCAFGALVAFIVIQRTERVTPTVQPSVHQPCHEAARADTDPSELTPRSARVFDGRDGASRSATVAQW